MDVNDILKKSNLSLKDILELVAKFNRVDLTNENDIKYMIQEVSNKVNKQLSNEEQNKIVELVQKRV